MQQERIRFIEHKEREVLLIDLGGLVEREILDVLIAAAKQIRTYPSASLLTFTDATTVQFTLRDEAGDYDRVAAETIRNCVAGNRPHVKAAAIALGEGESERVIVQFFNRVGERDFEVFDSSAEALDWLVEQ